MTEALSLEPAAVDDLLYLLRKNIRGVLRGSEEKARLILDDFEDDLLKSEPRKIFTAKGIQRVSRALRWTALEALQTELGMGRIIYHQLSYGPLWRTLGLSEHEYTTLKHMFKTAKPNVFFVQITSWKRGCDVASRTTWYLVRTDTTFLSRLQRRVTGWLPFMKR